MAEAQKLVGHLKTIFRYPVKSMRGEALSMAVIGWNGIEGDRRWAFSREGVLGGFPWLTAREGSMMVRYVPHYVDPGNIRESGVMVTTPDDRDLALESADLMDEMAKLSGPVHLIALSRGCFDSAVISLISTASVQVLGEEAGVEGTPRRFRPNLLVEPVEPVAFVEEDWIGSTLAFGERDDSPHIRLDRRNKRCAITNVHPETGQREPDMLKTIVRLRDEYAGTYGSVEKTGSAREGDPIYLIS